MYELQCIIYTQRLMLYDSELISLRDYGRKNNAPIFTPPEPVTILGNLQRGEFNWN